MKIRTITCNDVDNLGASLQAYALVEHLRSLGHDAALVDYRPHYMSFATKLWYNPGVDIKLWLKLFLHMPLRYRLIKRHKRFVDFRNSFIPTTRIYKSLKQLQEQPPTADVYIAGSDQIWNTVFQNGRDRAFFLDFGDKDIKRISYAASFATPDVMPDVKDFVKHQLNNFDAISVRENSALDILENLGQQGTRVVDPVFLLSADFWRDNMADDSAPSKGYLLVYDFEKSESIKKIAKRIASLRGLEIISVAPDRLSYARRNHPYCTPQQFVTLVMNADCVVSNSFHATAFALIFKREFFVVNRDDGHNLRMADLLEAYGLSDRIISADAHDDILSESIDYTSPAFLINRDTVQSKAWLESALQSKKSIQ